MRGKRIVFSGPNTARLEDFEIDEDNLAEDEVLIETERTLISTGTELANFTGLSPNVWVKGAWGAYPHVPGYTALGTVRRVGDAVKDFGREGSRVVPGTRVFAFTPHASIAVAKVSSRLVFPVADDDDPQEMLLSRMAMVAMSGMRALRTSAFGRTGVVIGLGLVGLFAAQLYSSGGGEVLGLDRAPRRVELAKSLGITAEVGPDDTSWRTNMADTVIEAIGNPALVPVAVDMARPLGEVILLGSPRGQGGEMGPMLSDVHHKGVSITGAFEWLPPFHDAKAGWGPSLETTVHTVMSWIRTGRLRTEGMVSQVASPESCQEVFGRLASDRNAQFGVVFDWQATG